MQSSVALLLKQNDGRWRESHLRDQQLQSQEQITKILNRHQTLHSKDRSRTFGDNAMVKIFCFPLTTLRLMESKKINLCMAALKCQLHISLHY